MKSKIRLVALFCMICILFTCKQKEAKVNVASIQEDISYHFTTKSALDTILKYESLDICNYKTPDYWYDNDGFILFIDNINQPNIGVISSPSNTYIFVKKGMSWRNVTLDSLAAIRQAMCIETYDINGDGNKDIKFIDNNGAYMSETQEYLLFDKRDTTFRYNRFYSCIDEYDKKTGLVRYCSTPPHLHSKGTYKIVGDSLEIIDEISHGDLDFFEEIETPKEYRGCVATHYKYKNGKKKLIKVVLNKTDTTQDALDYFIHAVWKIDWEY
jgi:hypothetical protein